MDTQESLQAFAAKIPGKFAAAVGFVEEQPVTLNPDEVFPAASLIKVPILFYLLKERQAGKIDLNELSPLQEKDKVGGSGILLELHAGIPVTLMDLAILMIVVSDNTATNLLMDRLGTEEIQAWIESIGLSQTILARKMMIAGDNAPPANFTSAADMFLLYKQLSLGKLLNSQNTLVALDILSRQQYNDKIPLLLPKGTKVAHKTGEISGVRHDCGIIIQGNRKYGLCLLTKEVSDEQQTDREMAELSLKLYERNLKA